MSCPESPAKRSTRAIAARTRAPGAPRVRPACGQAVAAGISPRRRRGFRSAVAALAGALLLPLPLAAAPADVAHDLRVVLRPAEHAIEVTDTVTLPDGTRDAEFVLHAGLAPTVAGDGAALRLLTRDAAPGGVPLERYAVTLPHGERRFTLRYAGRIHHPVARAGQEYARGFGVSPGIIGADGVFLSGASRWYPGFGDALLTFDLEVTLPAGWRSMSQGERTRRERDGAATDAWRIDRPQDEIFLIAAAFTEYRQPAGAVDAMVLLREPDPALAARYLEATGRYVEMYRKLIGPYPYSKFALVENFWETGYGMPSFTLLGPRVIRLPFILHSSYPHEILHNWWGNGVFVDYASGNWSEGLTSYLADHLIKEQRGQGADYRRAALQKYADYVRDSADFPLRAFRGRHGSVTEAVGYGKTLMVFHMLRRQIGDERFREGLRRLYREHRFRVAGFDDVAASFSAAAGEPLDDFFAQWVERAGAPALRVSDVTVREDGGRHVLAATLEQVHDGEPYALRVPVAVHLDGQARALQREVTVAARRERVEIDLPARPLRVDVDPEFDLFRRLDRAEIPPAISQVLGAERVLFVLPAAAPDAVRDGYASLVESWRRGRAGDLQVASDADIDALPDDRAVWLFGWENRFRAQLARALAGYDFAADGDGARLAGTSLARDTDAVVAVGRHPERPEHAIAWVALDNVAAMPGLARKLPHYGRYGYLGFRGDEPSNVAKGEWPVLASPMSVTLAGGGSVPAAALAPREPLAEPPAVFSAERMMDDVRALADPSLDGRGLGTPGLDRAAEHIAARFRALGLAPGGDAPGSYFQTWTADPGAPVGPTRLRNVVAVLPGTRPEWAAQSVVVGAHYDHLGRGWPDVRAGDEGRVHPGADDNASGVAAMLELARVLAERGPQERSVVFAAFTGEEAGKLGSRHYLEQAGEQAGEKTRENAGEQAGENAGEHAGPYPAGGVIGMINLDTVGRLGDGKLLVLGASSAREWVHVFRGAGFVTGVAVESVARDLDSSDHASFVAAGVPAVQLFSGANEDYHRPGDTADKVDAAGLVKVAAVLDEAVSYLAARPEPLTSTLDGGSGTRAAAARPGARRASLGTVPDFTHTGRGVRLDGVVDGSPAARAGLREGDVIVGIDARDVDGLQGYADALRALAPGDTITVRLLRDGQPLSVQAQLATR